MFGFAVGCGDSGTGGAGGQPVGGNGNGGDAGGAPIAGAGGEGGDANGGADAGGGGADAGGAGAGGAPPAADVVWSNVGVTDGCFYPADLRREARVSAVVKVLAKHLRTESPTGHT